MPERDTSIEEIRKAMLAAQKASIPYYFFVLHDTEAMLKPTSLSAEKIQNMTIADVHRMAVH